MQDINTRCCMKTVDSKAANLSLSCSVELRLWSHSIEVWPKGGMPVTAGADMETGDNKVHQVQHDSHILALPQELPYSGGDSVRVLQEAPSPGLVGILVQDLVREA